MLAHDHFIPPAAVCQDGRQVAHRAGWDEQPGLFAQSGGCQLLKLVDGRVILIDIVTHHGFCHGLAHGGGWFGDRI